MPGTEPYQHVLLPTNDPQGKPILAILAKRTYDLKRGEQCIPSAEQLPLFPADRFFDNGDPLTASCEFESDFIPYKPLTDVVLNGKAHPPRSRPVRSMVVSLSLGKRSKAIQVFGDRRCLYRGRGVPAWTDPQPFVEMSLRFENAYGGVDIRSREDGGALFYPRNPIGKGYVILHKKESIEGLPLPNLEEPENLLTPETLVIERWDGWQKQPLPQSFGWTGKHWFPRCMYAGVMPEHVSLYEEIREASLGHVPKDLVESFKKLRMKLIDFHFFNGAPIDMQLEGVHGGELVRLVGMDPDGPFEFALPSSRPLISIDIGNGPSTPEPVLQTVCILKELGKLYMLWRASVPYPGPERMQELTKLESNVTE